MFPYVVVRLSPNIGIRGFGGRDAILVPFGLAILIDAMLEMICRKGKTIIVYAVMLLSLFYFNSEYMGYQIDTYWNKGFQENLRMNQDLKTCNSILLLPEGGHRGNEEYNGMAEEVYGDDSRLIFAYRDDVDLDTWITKGVQYNEKEIAWEPFNMTEWKGQNKKIDAIVFYSNSFSRSNAMRIRIKEIFGGDIKKDLLQNSSFKALYSDDREFDSVLQEVKSSSPLQTMTEAAWLQFESIKDMLRYFAARITNDPVDNRRSILERE